MPYLALFRARFRELLRHRTAALAGLANQLFFGVVRTLIVTAFFHPEATSLTLAQAVSYIWLGQAFFYLLPFSSNPDAEVREMIRSGQVAYELARPLDLHGLWLSRALAARVVPTLMRAPPLLLLALVGLGLRLPASAASGAAALTALLSAAWLTATFATLITSTVLWTQSADGMNQLVPSLVLVGSGLVIPLPLFPDWAQKLLTLLPFRGMADDPFRLYLGLLPPGALGAVLGRQLFWTALLYLIGRALVSRGRRRLVVQGV